MGLDTVCTLPSWQHFLIILLVQFVLGLINLYMSKTESVKSNSIAELIFNLLVSMMKRKQ